MTPVEGFRALARSSPERWTSVSFASTSSWRAPVTATVRRPDRLHVVDAAGTVLASGAVALQRGGWRPTPEPGAPRRADQDLDTVPVWRDYHWIAVLDPAELADGVDGEPGTEVHELRQVEHHGRPALEALLVPTGAYAPRCTCCPLLPCALCDRLEGLPEHERPDAHRVRLDLETAVCVQTVEVGGPAPGVTHDLRITAVRRPAG